jgi:hypothetical protein
MVAGPLSLGVSLIMQRVLEMPLRSRRMVLESLESRQLLSVAHPSAEVSVLAKSKQFTVVGSLTGSLTISPGHGDSLVATGNVGKLGTLQLQGTDPKGTHVGDVFTFTTAQGTLTFTSTFSAKPVHNGYTLKLKHRTGAYAGWTGTGMLNVTAPPGPAPVFVPGQPFPVVVPLRLTLKP